MDRTFSRSKVSLAVAMAVAACAAMPEPVVAQQAPAVSESLISEVIVTARRREETLQQVPIAITAIGGPELESRGIESLGELNSVIPNLSVLGGGATGEAQGNFRVRGLPGVAVYVDGVWQSSTDGLLTQGVLDIERIEVLRGPQGTLFGKNAMGGAIQYVTKAPTGEFGGKVSGTLGTFDRHDMRATVDLPLLDTLSLKLTGSTQKRKGFLQSTKIDAAYGDVNDQLYRGDLLWKPFDGFSARYNYEITDVNRFGPARTVNEIGPRQFFAATGYQTNPQAQAYANIGIDYSCATSCTGQGALANNQTAMDWVNEGLKIDLRRQTLDLKFDVNDWLKVRSIAGFRTSERVVQTDFDAVAEVHMLERSFRAKNRQISEELQILGSHQKFDWVVGGFWWQEQNWGRTWTGGLPEMTCDMWGTRATAPGRGLITQVQKDNCLALRTRSIAGGQGVTQSLFGNWANSNSDTLNKSVVEGVAEFVDVTWRATDKLTVAAGLRNSNERNSSYGLIPTYSAPVMPQMTAYGSMFAQSGENRAATKLEFDSMTKRLTVQYQWNPSVMTYAGYSEGFSAGGQSSIAANYAVHKDITIGAIPYGPERSKNMEVGLRADWFDRSVRTNITAFKTDWDGVQVSQYIATYYPQINGSVAGSATQTDRNQDGKPDLFVYPALFTTVVSKAAVQGLEFEGLWVPTREFRANFNFGYLKTEYTELGLAGTGALPAVSKGAAFPGAPKMTLNMGAQYAFALANGAKLTPRIDFTRTDKYVLFSNEIQQRVQEAYNMLDARMVYDSGKNWTASLSGSNLTNSFYANSGFFSYAEQINFNTIGRPREYALTVDFHF
ncbi:MAG: TonB-dependent receptor [Proteobacteria bacterium]|nr:TonB-dependent receptor [Pseudomonadota bacterium]